jgi:hypothetical protein
LQKLSVDYSKASEALRTWSLSEGDDLEVSLYSLQLVLFVYDPNRAFSVLQHPFLTISLRLCHNMRHTVMPCETS